MLKADDQFFRRPSAIICNKNKSDKVLKFVSKYINTHGVPRKFYMDHGSSFTSKVLRNSVTPKESKMYDPRLTTIGPSSVLNRP